MLMIDGDDVATAPSRKLLLLLHDDVSYHDGGVSILVACVSVDEKWDSDYDYDDGEPVWSSIWLIAW